MQFENSSLLHVAPSLSGSIQLNLRITLICKLTWGGTSKAKETKVKKIIKNFVILKRTSSTTYTQYGDLLCSNCQHMVEQRKRRALLSIKKITFVSVHIIENCWEHPLCLQWRHWGAFYSLSVKFYLLRHLIWDVPFWKSPPSHILEQLEWERVREKYTLVFGALVSEIFYHRLLPWRCMSRHTSILLITHTRYQRKRERVNECLT